MPYVQYQEYQEHEHSGQQQDWSILQRNPARGYTRRTTY